MSVTRTFTVTVVSTGSGNKYFIDGVQQATINLAEGYTYKFDQSDSSNATHPLRLSTTSDGTHNSGSEYTTGVTTNGTPGSADAYTQITVAASAPTLYYYCTNHSGMGGQANTVDSDTWGVLPWNQNSWGKQDGADISVSGFGLTSSVGDGTNMGVPAQGWGGTTWSNGEWGEVTDNSVELTGISLSTSLGTVSVTSEINSGWGRDSWGEDGWGIPGTVLLTGQSATTSVGSLSPADVLSPTGQEATTNVGSPTIIGNVSLTLTGQSATTSVGTGVNIIEGIGVDGQSATSSVGSLAPADIMGVTGISSNISLGSISVNSNPIVILSGNSATSSVGSIDPADQVMGLTGQSSTSSVGTGLSISSTFDITLTGLSATASVAAFGTATGFGIQAFENVDTGSNSSYTDVATGSNTSYTDAA